MARDGNQPDATLACVLLDVVGGDRDREQRAVRRGHRGADARDGPEVLGGERVIPFAGSVEAGGGQRHDGHGRGSWGFALGQAMENSRWVGGSKSALLTMESAG